MGRLLGPFDPPPPQLTARQIQGAHLDPMQRIYAVDRGDGDDATVVAEGTVTPDGVVAWHRISILPAVVDLDADEYKDITDGRSAGDPSRGT